MTTRIISLHDDDESLPAPVPLPISSGQAAVIPPAPHGGVLVVEDGTVVVLHTTTLIGRDPQAHPQVRRGEVLAVALGDARSSVSRVHAELRVSAQGVEVVDRGSTNGTMVTRVGESAGRLLRPEEPEALQAGDVVSFGGLQCRFELLDTMGRP